MVNETARIIEEHQVASITTNSLREILKLFLNQGKNPTYNITRLKANASSSHEELPAVENEKYGIVGYLDKRVDSFFMDYELSFDEEGSPINPIDKTGIETIESDLERLGIEDAAVDFLQILIRDRRIGELAGVEGDLFHVTLTSDPPDGDLDKEKIKEHHINEELVREHGFKYRILHTRKVIDRRQELTVPKSQHKYIIYWTGETMYSLKSPKKIAQHLKEAHYGEYKLIKVFGAGSEDTLVLLSVSR